MAKVAIVCDSTCDLGPEWLEAHDVTMVPLKVLFGERSFLDWVEIRPQEFFERLRNSPNLPKTSQPSPADFEAAYKRLADAGAEGIVSIHLSAALSGTYSSASIAMSSSPVPVRLIDSMTVSSATGLVIRAAIEARDAGGDFEVVASAAEKAVGDTRFLFVLDTLEYLVKGGRAGKAQGLAATLLDIKPILTVDETGVIAPLKKVRGLKRAISELAKHVAEDAAGRRVRIAFVHACKLEMAEELHAALEATGIDAVYEDEAQLGAVIGTYSGPGAVGIGYRPIG